ncbi:hypothetical protein CEXT_693301 [Caerostris extrusa]|uniref:Uncharacterized protein n=1 Tax=Caerostris extrusa TaxID=172846 RepID=A0AAV4QF58_CAEEX|nr:hypothetical protein CEXT_693301 [Caerostris extrusa]
MHPTPSPNPTGTETVTVSDQSAFVTKAGTHFFSPSRMDYSSSSMIRSSSFSLSTIREKKSQDFWSHVTLGVRAPIDLELC